MKILRDRAGGIATPKTAGGFEIECPAAARDAAGQTTFYEKCSELL